MDALGNRSTPPRAAGEPTPRKTDVDHKKEFLTDLAAFVTTAREFGMELSLR